MSLSVDIHKTFGDFTLDVTFETDDSVLGILGASGSGKSMTLRCIAGIVKPDSGEIVCNGRTLYSSKKGIDLPARARRTGLMFQSYALFPNMTVRQNIAAGVRDRAEVDSLVARYVGLLHLEGLEERYPSQLSGGQQQRVAIARMMASEPDVLMMDEPFSALDRHLRFTIEQEFSQALEQFHGTVLYVSHNVGEIYQYCRDTLVLSSGQVAERGGTVELFRCPVSVEGARLTGCKNITEVHADADGVYSVDWNCALPLSALPEGVHAVGVRDGGIRLSALPEGGVPVTVMQVRHFPQDDVLHLLPNGARHTFSEAFGRAQAEEYVRLSTANALYLHFDPERLLLLK